MGTQHRAFSACSEGPILNAKYLLFSPDFIIFLKKKNEEKNATKKKKKGSVNLNVSIDHAVYVTTCCCKQLLNILITGYVYWQKLIYIESKAMCAQIKIRKYY